MTPQSRHLCRQAAAIQAQHADAAGPIMPLPNATWRECEELSRRMRRAEGRGWRLAAGRLRIELQEDVRRLRSELSQFERQLHLDSIGRLQSTLRDTYADLAALHEEFDEVVFDAQETILSVTTEPIVLEETYLGPFEIRLDWSIPATGHPGNYRVIAREPHPAASSESVTHPHVQDEALCEGDGREPIRSALIQGRLLDFFLIVANLLRTYNSSSPYVAIKDWLGAECLDCGSSVSDDDLHFCDRCEGRLCDECYYCCASCGEPFCCECVTRCDGCEEHYCKACLQRCALCRTLLCLHCLDDNERCETCNDQDDEAAQNECPADKSVAESDPNASLQPNRLGETSVPA